MSQPGTILNLASGGTVRVTPYLLEIRPVNSPAIPIDIQQISGGIRNGSTVTVDRYTGGSIQLDMASLDDAGQLEQALRAGLAQVRATPAAPPYYPPPPASVGSGSGIPKVLVVVGVLLLVCVVLGIVASQDDRGGTTSGPAARSTNTPRPTATAVRASTAYQDRMLAQAATLGSSFDRFAALMENPRIGNESWTIQVAAELVTWRSAYSEAQRWSPPAEFRAAHSKYLEALRTYNSASYDIADGIDNLDIARIERANQKILEGNSLIGEATRLLPTR